MLENLSQFAEQAATSVSRRAFLGQLGRGAFFLAGVLGGLLAVTMPAAAAPKRCCLYACSGQKGVWRTCHRKGDGPCIDSYHGTEYVCVLQGEGNCSGRWCR
jgi:hypothetical protein